MSSTTIIDRQLRKVRLHGVPERRDLRRRRARLMAQVAASTKPELPRQLAEDVKLSSLGPNWTIGDIIQSVRNRLPARA